MILHGAEYLTREFELGKAGEGRGGLGHVLACPPVLMYAIL